MAQLADVVHQETGKPHGDAHARGRRWPSTTSPGPAAHAEKVLGRRKVSARAADGQPGGVGGVPPARRRRRDRPVELPGLHADGLDRLRARRRQRGGLQAQRAHARRRRVAGRQPSPRSCPTTPVLQVVTGFGETGAALCRSGVDKLAFTGSTATGKKVMAACAETLTPVLIEAGGKDALLVDEDADVDGRRRRRRLGRVLQRRPDLHRRRAGLRPRAGLRRVPRRADPAGPGELHAGDRRRRQDRADDDARARSTSSAATSTTRSPAAAGPWSAGRRRWASGSSSRPSWSTCPRTRAAVTEETFGPTVTVAKVRDMDEAVELANATRYGLGSTVFSQGARHGARRAGSARA